MDSLHDRIGFLLRNAYQNLNRDFRKKLTQERITIHQYVVLQGLGDLGEAIQRTLAEHCAIEPSNLNVMIKRMKANGLIEHVGEAADPRDALALTRRGRAVLRRFQDLDVAVTQKFLEPLTEAEAKTLRTALTKLVQHSR
ncbi:MAG: winged helix-turn-helix transcriptional regulator [Rhodospirillaceae bacterium]|nr:winged helix-turn-helix transcriptional regulator [Rhodospirillaceae bacterium]MYB12836.1 winged helix-turn-helix transcriptional regulator [Rhodospirillaceae bacterium]MYI48586.1 winged helix-turn-helix transcriptional regulator [Rhodospirillaceae bacterium]